MKPAIKIDDLGKRYLIGNSGRNDDSFRDALISGASALFRRNRHKNTKEFWALRNATFNVKHGENVGIIGLNGAGKSTLLKILSRITEPTSGSVEIDGRVGALLEVGTGFHGELTGRENVFLYGSILGMGREEVRRKFDAIVDFAGIPQFIDTPVKRYSSGMYVKLAFAVAAHLEPEILLLDEVLAVGDLAFQRKCLDHAKELQKRDATILFVSHNMHSIKTMCDRVIYLKSGQVLFDGSVAQGIEVYEKDCQLSNLSWIGKKPEDWPMKITGCALSSDGEQKSLFDHGERMRIRISFHAKEKIRSPNFIVAMIRSDGVACCNFNNETDGVEIEQIDGDGTIELVTPPLKLISDMYSLSIIVREKGFQQILCGQIGGTFHVRHPVFDTHFGVFHESASWTLPAIAAADKA